MQTRRRFLGYIVSVLGATILGGCDAKKSEKEAKTIEETLEETKNTEEIKEIRPSITEGERAEYSGFFRENGVVYHVKVLEEDYRQSEIGHIVELAVRVEWNGDVYFLTGRSEWDGRRNPEWQYVETEDAMNAPVVGRAWKQEGDFQGIYPLQIPKDDREKKELERYERLLGLGFESVYKQKREYKKTRVVSEK